MRIAASEFILFCNPPADNVSRLRQIVPEVELMLDGDAWDYTEEGWPQQAEALKKLGGPYTVHPAAWDVNPAAPLRVLREAASFLNKAAIRFCHTIGGSQVVYHPGYYDRDSCFSKKRALDFCYGQLEELVALAEPLGITIAFENIACPASALFTQEEYLHALDGIPSCVQFLLDVGHAHCNHWDIPGVIDGIGERLCGFHLHDNDGTGDLHLPIGEGTIDWEPVFGAMRELPEDVLYVMEYAAKTPLNELEKGKRLLLEKVGG